MTDVSEHIEILINKILSKNAPAMLEFLAGLSQEDLSKVGLTKEDIENGDLNHILYTLHHAKLVFNFQLNGIVNGARETGQSIEKILKSPVSQSFMEHSEIVMKIVYHPSIDETDKFLLLCEKIRGVISPPDIKIRMLASLELKTFGKGR